MSECVSAMSRCRNARAARGYSERSVAAVLFDVDSLLIEIISGGGGGGMVMVMIVVVCTSCWGVLLLLRMCSVVTWKSPFVVPWSVFMRLVLRATAERQRKCPRARDATYQTAPSLSAQRN